MGKKGLVLGGLVAVFLALSIPGVTQTKEPAQLIVARDSGGFLHLRTCNGPICSTWKKITGRFRFQPTLVWDDDVQRYYLYGVDYGNNLWRSSFDRYGKHANDWVAWGGSSPSPVAAAGQSGFTHPQTEKTERSAPIRPSQSTPKKSTARVSETEDVVGQRTVSGSLSAIAPTSLPSYTIQLESWRRMQTATKSVRYLKSLGLKAFSNRVDLPGKGIYYRVFVGLFADRKQAREFQAHMVKEYNLGKGAIMRAPAAAHIVPNPG